MSLEKTLAQLVQNRERLLRELARLTADAGKDVTKWSAEVVALSTVIKLLEGLLEQSKAWGERFKS